MGGLCGCLSAEQNFKFWVFVISVLLWWASCDMPVISIREEKKKKKESTLPGFEPGFLIPKICQCAAADQMI